MAEERIRREFLKKKDVEGSDWSESSTPRVEDGGRGLGKSSDKDCDKDSDGIREDGVRDKIIGDRERSRDSRSWMDGSRNISARGDEKDDIERGPHQDERDKRLQGEIRQLQLETVST